MKDKWKERKKERKVVINVFFLSVTNVWAGSKIGLKILEIKRARKLTLHLINVAEINAQQK